MQIDIRPMLIPKGKVADKTPVDLVWLSGLLKNIGAGILWCRLPRNPGCLIEVRGEN